MKTIINIKTDVDVKNNAQKIAKELGLPLGTVINAYLREFIRNRSAYFSAVLKMTKSLEKIISGVEKDIENNKNLSKAFNTSSEMDTYLDNL